MLILAAIMMWAPLRTAEAGSAGKEGQVRETHDIPGAAPSGMAGEVPKPSATEIEDIARSVPEIAYARVDEGEKKRKLMIACKGECTYRTLKAVQEKLNDKGIYIWIRIFRGNAEDGH